MTPIVVLADTNVLFSRVLRDHLMYAALSSLVDLRWSAAILDELERSLVSRTSMTHEQAARLRNLMDLALPHASCTPQDGDYAKTAHLPMPDEADRHVVATAISARATVLCTNNARDFPPPIQHAMGIRVASPDEVLCSLILASPGEMVRVHEQCVSGLPSASSASTLVALDRAGASQAAMLLALAMTDTRPGSPDPH